MKTDRRFSYKVKESFKPNEMHKKLFYHMRLLDKINIREGKLSNKLAIVKSVSI